MWKCGRQKAQDQSQKQKLEAQGKTIRAVRVRRLIIKMVNRVVNQAINLSLFKNGVPTFLQ